LDFPSNITHTYTTAERFTAQLIVTDSNGCINTQDIEIDAAQGMPSISLGTLPASIVLCQGDIFNDTVSAEDGNGNIIPVTTTSSPDPFDTNVPNTYTLTYSATGATNVTRTVVVNATPVASFTVDQATITEGSMVNFDASASTASSAITYTWNFGDGSPIQQTTNPTIAHQYSTNTGSPFTAILSIEDANGCTSVTNASQEITVNPATSPFIDLGALPATVTLCQEAIFTDTVSAEDGNGNTIPVTTTSSPDPFDTNLPGTYTLTYSAAGATDMTRTVVVNATPIASFNVDQLTITEGETVNFDASASTASSAITYTWNFGDGSPIQTTTNPTVDHTYSTSAGSPFTATLTIEDTDGCTNTNTASQEIIVNVNGSATVAVNSAKNASYVTENVQITIDIDETNGGNGPYTAGYRNATGSFDLSNGTSINVDTDISIGNNITNWTFIGNAAGNASFEIFVKDASGTEIGTQSFTIAVQDFAASITSPTSNPISEDTGTEVDFAVLISETFGQPGNQYDIIITTDQGTNGTITVGTTSYNGGSANISNIAPGIFNFSYVGNTSIDHVITVDVRPSSFASYSKSDSQTIQYQLPAVPFTFSASSVDNFLFFNNETDINLNISPSAVGGGTYEVRWLPGTLAGGTLFDQNNNPVSANTWTTINSTGLTTWRYETATATGVTAFDLEARNSSGGTVTGNPQNIQINVIDFAITVNPTTTITETAGTQVTNLSVRVDPTNTSFISTYNLVINSDQIDGIFNAGDTQINTTVNGGASFNFNYTGTSINLHNLSVSATPAGQTVPTRTNTFNIDYVVTNQPPVPVDDSFDTSENTIVTGNLFADNGPGTAVDGDPDADSFVVHSVNGSTAAVNVEVGVVGGGLVTINDNGAFSFDPNANFGNLNAGETDIATITYELRDSNGNVSITEGIISVTITGIDPTITLNGLNEIVVLEGTSFSDPGVTTNDGSGNTIPFNVDQGGYNINTPGVYTFTYSLVSNPSINVTRTVIVNDIPAAEISPSADSAGGPAPFTTAFASYPSSDVVGGIVLYTWKGFEDGSEVTATTAGTQSYTFSIPGVYTVELEVEDLYGETSTDTFTVTVTSASTVTFSDDNTINTTDSLASGTITISGAPSAFRVSAFGGSGGSTVTFTIDGTPYVVSVNSGVSDSVDTPTFPPGMYSYSLVGAFMGTSGNSGSVVAIQ
ncbi:beta strand repeat-containing protein, partial [Spongiivirga citrea]